MIGNISRELTVSLNTFHENKDVNQQKNTITKEKLLKLGLVFC